MVLICVLNINLQARKEPANSDKEKSKNREYDDMSNDENSQMSSPQGGEPPSEAPIQHFQDKLVEMFEELQQQISNVGMEIAELKAAIHAMQTATNLLDPKIVRQNALYYLFSQFPKSAVIKVHQIHTTDSTSQLLTQSIIENANELQTLGKHNSETSPSSARIHPSFHQTE